MTGSNNDDRRAINHTPPGPSFKFRHELRPPADPNKLPLLPYYDRHPELRPRRQTRRTLRRRLILEV